jgi:drug/metabolite transporter (DMT)-like permease
MELLIPTALALAAAMLFSLNAHFQRQALANTDATTGALLSVGSTAALCWILSPLMVNPEWFTHPSALIFAGVGIFFPAMGQYLQIAGVGMVGPSLTASLSAFTPVFAIVLGIVWLGETPALQGWIGLALTLAGLVLATWSPKGLKRGWPLWALLLPLGAAAARGLAQPSLKYGMQDLPSPFFALLLGSTVATLVLGLLALHRRARGRMRVGPGWKRFVLVGGINGVGILSLNAALGLGALMLVSPLLATTPIWTLLLGVTLFRSETLGWRHLWVALLVVVGCVLIMTQ